MKLYGKGAWRFALLTMVGVAVIASADLIAHEFLSHVVAEAGIALLIAGILALVVDSYLKRELAKDAVEAALGYLLPPPLRDEMRWLHEQKVICERHQEQITLERFGYDAVVVNVKYDRTLINSSADECDIDVGLAIDEWGHPTRKSVIKSFGYEGPRGRVEMVGATVIVNRPDAHVLAVKTDKITLRPGERLTVWAVYEEISNRNGQHVMTYRYPTLNPRVQVVADDSLQVQVAFGHRAKFSPQRIGSDIWELRGLLLPTQYIRLVWWPKVA